MTEPAESALWSSGVYVDYLYCGPQGRVMTHLHRKMEAPFGPRDHFPLTVEVGAGEGQHLPFVRHTFDRYVMTEIREVPDVALPLGVERSVADAEDLPFPRGSVDRLVSTCVLHHLDHPEQALRSWRDVVRPGGMVTILLATDPGLAHRVGRFLTTRRAARKMGIDFDLEMAREHRNHAQSLMRLVEASFARDRVRYVGLPFPWRTWNLNYSSIYQIKRAA